MRRWKISFHLNISSTPLHLRWCPAICDTHLMESSNHASNCQKIWSWMIVTKPRGCNLPHPKLELPEDFLSEEGSGWFRSWGGNYQSPQCCPGNDDDGGGVVVNCPTRWYLYSVLSFGYLYWSSSWRWQAHMRGYKLLRPLKSRNGRFWPGFSRNVFSMGMIEPPKKLGFTSQKWLFCPTSLPLCRNWGSTEAQDHIFSIANVMVHISYFSWRWNNSWSLIRSRQLQCKKQKCNLLIVDH